MIIQFDIPNNPHKNRQFCTLLDNVYLHNTGKDISDGNADDLLVITHDGKNVKAGIHKDTQKSGDREIYYPNSFNTSTEYDEEINDNIFLMFDVTMQNYMHCFFDLFGNCLYFDILKKEKNIKLGIPEECWVDEGKNNFIKQWLTLYYGDDIDIVIFKKNQTYKIKHIILPNGIYWHPEYIGHQPIMEMISKVASKVSPIKITKKGCYISRQDTIKYGWYHKREMENELELIEKIKKELDYDIIEMMDYNLIEKIQLSKSYKNIIQQNGASNLNILFSLPETVNIILTNPKMGPWINQKCSDYSLVSGCTLLVIDDIGEIINDPTQPPITDPNNHPWKITDIDGVINLLKQIDDGSIWNS
jgi:hypothetical protein